MLIAAPANTGNRFFDNMPASARQLLMPLLQYRDMHTGQPVYEPGDKITQVVFPIDCMLSVVLDLTDGIRAEIAIVGSEGFSSVNLAMGQPSSMFRTDDAD